MRELYGKRVFKRMLVLGSALLITVSFPAQIYAEGAESKASVSSASLQTHDIKEVLTALADPEYDALYSALERGETITQGKVGENSRILQKMLVEFGCDIAIDSSAGPGTFGALNQVRNAFGLANVNLVDTTVAAEMFPLLLIARDTDGTYADLLQSYFEEDEKEGSHYLYLKGCADFAAGRYYHAMEAFQESGYKDFEERAAACEQPLSSNGELWHNSSISGSDMLLEFEVNSYDESEAMCFEVYTEDGTKAAVLFLTGSGTVSTWLPGGNYRIKDATGKTWYGPDDAFGRQGSYEFMRFYEFDEDEYLTRLDAGYEWTITINVAEGNPDATGVESVDTDWDTWTSALS